MIYTKLIAMLSARQSGTTGASKSQTDNKSLRRDTNYEYIHTKLLTRYTHIRIIPTNFRVGLNNNYINKVVVAVKRSIFIDIHAR